MRGERCSYCDRFTRKPHFIRIGKTTSVICPRCQSKSEARYLAATGATR